MAVFARSRSLIVPFNEKVRERIFGFGSRLSNASSSSGSEHDAESDVVSPSSASPCLSYLVQNFLENADGVEPSGDSPAVNDAADLAENCNYVVSDPADLIRDVIDPIVRLNADRFRSDLLSHVTVAVENFSLFRPNLTVLNRNVMAYLREIGFNAGVCKTKWQATPGGGLPAGSYEFIDVLRSFSSDSDSRYIIDLNFAQQFEIAKQTESFRQVIGALPRVFVAKSEDLKRIVRVIADEARRSMKINGITLPPWRKNRYMQSKWFGPYRRTTNQPPASAASPQPAVQCRSVGFFPSGGAVVTAYKIT